MFEESEVSASPPPEPPAVPAAVPVDATALAERTVDVRAMSDDGLSAATVELERLVGWAGARQARMLTERARRQERVTGPGGEILEFVADEVAAELAISRVAAEARIGTAVTLAGQLPATLSAWEAGDLDGGKVRIVADNARRLGHRPDLVPALEGRVLPRASGQTHGELRAACNRAIHRLDPDLGGKRHQRAYADRRVSLTEAEDGMAELWALLPAPAARALYDRLTAIAMRAAGSLHPTGADGSTTGPGDTGTDADGLQPVGRERIDARRADALADLGMGACTCTTGSPDTGAGAGAGAVRAAGGSCGGGVNVHLHVTVAAGTLLGLDDQPAHLAGYGPIPATMARDLSSDAVWRRILTDPATGAVTDVSRSYKPPPLMATLIRTRDQVCRFPGCRRAAHQCDIDHHQPFDKDGQTCPDNLITMCRHHHLLKHRAPGWDVHLDRDTGELTVTTPHGTTRSTAPHDHRPEPDSTYAGEPPF